MCCFHFDSYSSVHSVVLVYPVCRNSVIPACIPSFFVPNIHYHINTGMAITLINAILCLFLLYFLMLCLSCHKLPEISLFSYDFVQYSYRWHETRPSLDNLSSHIVIEYNATKCSSSFWHQVIKSFILNCSIKRRMMEEKITLTIITNIIKKGITSWPYWCILVTFTIIDI